MTHTALRSFGFSLVCCSIVFGGLLALAGCGGGSSSRNEPRIDSTDTRAMQIDELLAYGDSLGRFRGLLEDTGLQEQIDNVGPWTFFIPEDEAFQRSAYRLDTLYQANNLDSLQKVLSFHIVRGRIDTSEVQDSLQIATLFDEPIMLRRNGPRLTVMGANIIGYVPAQNGVIYVIDSVLELPPPDTSAQHGILFF